MSVTLPVAEDVKEANRRLYDAIAGSYETVDGRRDYSLVVWIRSRLHMLAREFGDHCLLDIGSGSGLVTRAARGIFDRSIAMDLSPGILTAARGTADECIAADTDALPFAKDTVDVISCFAVLHHLYDTVDLAGEVARVLRPGGVFWSDHDMDTAFYRRFRVPLIGYRRLRGAEQKYVDAAPTIDAQTYAMAEYREDGVDGERVVRQLREAGLEARAEYHWYGLATWSNRLFGLRGRSRGWAPLLRIIASKPRRRV